MSAIGREHEVVGERIDSRRDRIQDVLNESNSSEVYASDDEPNVIVEAISTKVSAGRPPSGRHSALRDARGVIRQPTLLVRGRLPIQNQRDRRGGGVP